MEEPNKTPVRVSLLKNVTSHDDAIDEPASLRRKEFHDKQAVLYWKEPNENNVPKWIQNIFPGESDLHTTLTTKSISAVLVVMVDTEFYALTFGHGRSLLDQARIESRFGLKVVLNRVSADSLRSIDRKSLDGGLRSTREQVPSLSPMSNFGIDIEKDFIKAVTGTSTIPAIGKTIAGADSFGSSMSLDLNNIQDKLRLLGDAFKDTSYKNNFEFIDNIAEVKTARANALNEHLVEQVKSGTIKNRWLAPPEIVDWERHGGFAFKKDGIVYDDLNFEIYLREKSMEKDDITVKKLKQHQVLHMSADHEHIMSTWTIFKCLYAEVEVDGELYILSDGKWFEVDEDYVAKIGNFLENNLDEWTESLPDYEHDRMFHKDSSGRKGEARYNAETATSNNYALLDAKMIVHGGANSKIEFCDLYRKKLLLHVKRYTRSSGLSHLFNQGSVSAELLLSDDEFRIKVQAKLTQEGTSLEQDNGKPDLSEYHIVFAVVSASSAPLKLPFFSQVALRNTTHFLKNTLGVGKVSLVKIQSV